MPKKLIQEISMNHLPPPYYLQFYFFSQFNSVMFIYLKIINVNIWFRCRCKNLIVPPNKRIDLYVLINDLFFIVSNHMSWWWSGSSCSIFTIGLSFRQICSWFAIDLSFSTNMVSLDYKINIKHKLQEMTDQ